jgi:hypothetical protein
MDAKLIHPDEFPNSKASPFVVTSPSDGTYNCIAWALESQAHFFWPSTSPFFDWPNDLPRKASLPSFIQFFHRFGFTPCENGELEPGFQKIVLFAKEKKPSHTARQLPDGTWTIKIGAWVDVRHTLEAMEGGCMEMWCSFLSGRLGVSVR